MLILKYVIMFILSFIVLDLVYALYRFNTDREAVKKYKVPLSFANRVFSLIILTCSFLFLLILAFWK